MSPVFADFVKRSGNQAVEINAADGVDLHLTSHGSDWLWAVFSIFALFFLIYLGFAFFYKKKNERFFFVTAMFNVFFLAVGYFTWASDLGFTGIMTEFNHVHLDDKNEDLLRQIFYSKFVVWFLAYPLLILNYGVFAAIEWPKLISTILATEIWIVGFLIGALIESSYKWGYFVFSIIGLIYVWYSFIGGFVSSAINVDPSYQTFSNTYSYFLSFILLLYPIAWGLSEGGNVIQPDSEAVFYGILDLIVFVVLQSYFLFYTRDADFTGLGIDTANHAVFHDEKSNALAASPQVTATTAVQDTHEVSHTDDFSVPVQGASTAAPGNDSPSWLSNLQPAKLGRALPDASKPAEEV